MTEEPLFYRLLPAIHRRLDAANGSPLLALAKVLDVARSTVEDGIGELYRDWFVETCEPRMLPLLASLVGLPAIPEDAHDPRWLVADAAAFARSKGTRAAAERRLRQLGGWPVQIRTGEAPGHVEVTVSRRSVFHLRGVDARAAPGLPTTFFHLHPLGNDVALCSLREGEQPLTRSSSAAEVATSIELRQLSPAGVERLNADEIEVADLSRWPIAATGARRVAIDPELGRLQVLDTTLEGGRWSSAFSYASDEPATPGFMARACSPTAGHWLAFVHSQALPVTIEEGQPPVFSSVAAAVLAFETVPMPGIIRILDSATYDMNGVRLDGEALACPYGIDDPPRLTIEALSGETPTLKGMIEVVAPDRPIRLTFDGVWLLGCIDVAGAVDLRIRHGLLRPRTGAVVVAKANQMVAPAVEIVDSTVGLLHLDRDSAFQARRSTLAGGTWDNGPAVTGLSAMRLIATTVMGVLEAETLTATDTVFEAAVVLTRPGGSMLDHCAFRQDPPPATMRNCIRVGYAQDETSHRSPISTASSVGGEIGAGALGRVAARSRLVEDALADILPAGVKGQVAWR